MHTPNADPNRPFQTRRESIGVTFQVQLVSVEPAFDGSVVAVTFGYITHMPTRDVITVYYPASMAERLRKRMHEGFTIVLHD